MGHRRRAAPRRSGGGVGGSGAADTHRVTDEGGAQRAPQRLSE